MPHETDASALIWLVWMVWIYWGIRSWLKQPSAGEGTENHGRETAPSGMMSLAATMPGFPDAGSEAERIVAPGRLAAFVAQIRQADPNFDLEVFRDRATAAYEAVATAFAAGDRQTLKPLLSDDVYRCFDSAIAEREARGESIEVIFSRIDKPEIGDGYMTDGLNALPVRFTADLFRTRYDMKGKVLAGDPKAQTRVCDRWVFARPQGSRNPAWQVVATNIARPVTAPAEECCA
jgi:predicted lipid-binding transport protein (Tim44 family)